MLLLMPMMNDDDADDVVVVPLADNVANNGDGDVDYVVALAFANDVVGANVEW